MVRQPPKHKNDWYGLPLNIQAFKSFLLSVSVPFCCHNFVVIHGLRKNSNKTQHFEKNIIEHHNSKEIQTEKIHHKYDHLHPEKHLKNMIRKTEKRPIVGRKLYTRYTKHDLWERCCSTQHLEKGRFSETESGQVPAENKTKRSFLTVYSRPLHSLLTSNNESWEKVSKICHMHIHFYSPPHYLYLWN